MADYPLKSPITVDIDDLRKTSFPYCETLTSSNGWQYILDQTGKTVILFQPQRLGSAGSIFSPYEGGQFAAVVEQIKDDKLRNEIKNQLKLSPSSKEDRNWFQNKIDGLQSEEKRIDALMKSARPLKYQEFKYTQQETRGAFQNEYVISTSKNVKRCVGTRGADPCVIMFVRREHKDGKYSEASVAHIDALTAFYSLPQLIPNFDGAKENFDVTVIAADVKMSRSILLKIEDTLKTPAFSKAVMYADVGQGTTGALMDIATGNIQKNVPIEDLGDKEQLKLKLTILGLQFEERSLGLAYDGRQESKLSATTKSVDMNDVEIPSVKFKKTPPTSQKQLTP